MTTSLLPVVKASFFDSNGNPLNGGKIYTYTAGTTTPLATYTDSTGGTPNTNPVVLDANGQANIWLGSNVYKIIVKDSSDATQYTTDNVVGNAPIFSTINLTGLTASSAVATDASKNLVSVANTGTGDNVLATSPTLTSPTFVTPTLGAATATSINFGGTALANYQEGTWTPVDASGAGLSFTGVVARYTRIGRVCYIECTLNYPATASGSSVSITGLPFTCLGYGTAAPSCTSGVNGIVRFNSGSSGLLLLNPTSGAGITNAAMSTGVLIFSGFYHI